uniref:Fas-binding factor 1 C-terminal domain-containing protein n=1 Tax=Anabas testudineus TaxID=64144 RepID=A0A3Q1HEF2_ANATE
MATKPKGKTSKSAFEDDLLDSLFDDKKHSVRGKANRGGPLSRSSATDNIFSMLAEEVKQDGGDTEDSDVSAADPNDILKNMKDMDDMDADLFASKKKPSSAPPQTKPFGNEGPKKDFAALENNVKPEGADEASTGGKKPNSAPSTSAARNYKKFTFSESGDDNEGLGQSSYTKDLDDPLADLLDDLLPDETKTESKTRLQQTKPEKSVQSPPASPILKNKTSKTTKKPTELKFDDDKDDLMDALGFDSDKNNSKKKETSLWSNKERSEAPQRARTRLDEILESLTSPRLLERPPTGERKDQSQEKQQQEKTAGMKELLLEDDLTFGSYQPTLGSTPEGRQSRRQSVRFSTEDVSASSPEKKSKPTTPTPTRHRSSADWLGLKANNDNALLEDDAKETKTSAESPKAPSSPLLERKSSLTSSHATAAAKVAADTPAPTVNISKQSNTEASKSQKKDDEESDWLAGALSRKKALPNSEAKTSKQEDSFDLREDFSEQVTTQAPRDREDTLMPVKTLQLERDQNQILLESLQQRHKQDIELMENTQKTRVKLLEDSAAQRDTRARQEYEDLMERLATVTRSAEQERSELQAQYQRKLAQAQQDRDREVERLRDLQRKSILEMKKDHEDQIQRLKKLKDEEIDAVTSATSQTRSLTVVIEQMEQFSSRLGEISSQVESTHEHTAHGLEQGARHRDEQLRIMQDRLAQQQKAMADERAYLKEIISRMDTQLNEQQRQLEKERWKMTAEQAKAESMQRALEEERRSLSMQMNMEREELERAKSALLEEQKSVMQHCAEERRKLAAEWAHFHTQERQRHERAEREVSSLLEKREGSILSLAQDQADLKLRTAELKQKEKTVAQEQESLDRLKEELERERERITSTALRLKTRAQEVEAFSKLSAEKYEEGERALQEAKRVEAEHDARLRKIQIQTEQLRQQEQRMVQVCVCAHYVNYTYYNLCVLPSQQIFLENLKKKSYRSYLNTD